MIFINHNQLTKSNNPDKPEKKEDIMTTHKMTIESGSAAQETVNMIADTAKSTYVVAVLTVLGVFAFITAVMIAWPAVSYLAAKFF
jgi:hypothetical protein